MAINIGSFNSSAGASFNLPRSSMAWSAVPRNQVGPSAPTGRSSVPELDRAKWLFGYWKAQHTFYLKNQFTAWKYTLAKMRQEELNYNPHMKPVTVEEAYDLLFSPIDLPETQRLTNIYYSLPLADQQQKTNRAWSYLIQHDKGGNYKKFWKSLQSILNLCAKETPIVKAFIRSWCDTNIDNEMQNEITDVSPALQKYVDAFKSS